MLGRCVALALLTCALACSSARTADGGWPVSGAPWREDPAWHDGQVELAEYEGLLELYGAPRAHLLRVYTNRQHQDVETTTKASGAEGVAVFKQHATQRVPTERYDYHFALTTFTRAGDLALQKLTRSTHEDCGASFTQLWREGEALRTLESGYFPGESIHTGRIEGAVAAFDQLPLLLRDFPFDAPRDVPVDLVPGLRSNRLVPLAAQPRIVRSAGLEELALPIGATRAHRLELLLPDGTREATFWMHADGAAPWLHVMVAFEGAGATYRLASHQRTRHWERP